MWDPVYGFGGTLNFSPNIDTQDTDQIPGNGPYVEDISNLTITSQAPGELTPRTGGGCITDGPFANVTLNIGPGPITTYNPHCLRRDFIPSIFVTKLTESAAAWTEEAVDFFGYDRRVELYPNLTLQDVRTHGGGHFAIGGMVGEMSDTHSSPGDPIFWLHHSKLDFEWNKWQRLGMFFTSASFMRSMKWRMSANTGRYLQTGLNARMARLPLEALTRRGHIPTTSSVMSCTRTSRWILSLSSQRLMSALLLTMLWIPRTGCFAILTSVTNRDVEKSLPTWKPKSSQEYN